VVGLVNSSSPGPQKKKFENAPLVVIEVRRSEQIKKINHGFKASSE
jgi:hypothetical protein